jgi:hypothetical protein
MGLHDPFGHLKHKIWLKEGSGIKLSIWFPTTKSRELPRFPCMQVVCGIPLESFAWWIQLCFKPHLNWSSTHKVMGPQSHGSPETKWHLSAGPVAKHKVYYKGEGGGFPQVRVVVSLVSPCLLMVRLCT